MQPRIVDNVDAESAITDRGIAALIEKIAVAVVAAITTLKLKNPKFLLQSHRKSRQRRTSIVKGV